ncbi:hypothetical protein [Pedobacter africanus]|uniref:Uncharacterized protein n=1 Tax=Pedobacter africanus TaxID=151894 RepID=A0A1W2CTI0_9SPHI|nr:hypothetical protein [Pedobacter africanus]SMC88547.1 hypothetical protein SAMN04488524_3203 [Pedobacter africanus]
MGTSKNKNSKYFTEISDKELIAAYRASPTFKKKNDDARAFIKKHPIPKDLFQK